MRTREQAAERWLRRACVGALVGLILMVWATVDPRPFPVVVAMSIGQLVGTASFVTLVLVLLRS